MEAETLVLSKVQEQLNMFTSQKHISNSAQLSRSLQH